MQRDKFLIEQTKLSEGWIPMEVMLKFKMLASLTQDIPTIVKALEASELIETSEDKTKIRRSLDHPLPVYDEEYRKAQEARTVYAKGFPLHGVTIDQLKTYFEPFEPIENIYVSIIIIIVIIKKKIDHTGIPIQGRSIQCLGF